MNEFTDHLKDVFRLFGAVEVRRMFGGLGIFRDGLMFALVYDEALYLKADEHNAADFVALGLGQFEYQQRGKTVKMSYYLAPDALLDDPAEAAQWARRSYEVALRQDGTKGKKRKRPAR